MGTFKANFQKSFYQILGKGKKVAPELSLIFGIGAIIGGTVMACKATWDIKTDVINAKEDIAMLEAENLHAKEPLSPEELEAKKKVVSKKLIFKIVKKYAVPVAVEAAGIGLTIAGHGIQKNRYAKLASAYSVVSGSYARYRDRVKEKLGEEADKEFRLGMKNEDVEQEVVDEKGKSKKVKSKIATSDYDGYSEYARYFDEASCFWHNDADINKTFVENTQARMNDRLMASARPGRPGIVLLNDVYEALDIPRTKEGSIMGWTYYPDGKNLNGGDNYISFGIYNVASVAKRRFVNGYEKNILLDFNVDPTPVVDYYPEAKENAAK